jgi:hypothetical protein
MDAFENIKNATDFTDSNVKNAYIRKIRGMLFIQQTISIPGEARPLCRSSDKSD